MPVILFDLHPITWSLFHQLAVPPGVAKTNVAIFSETVVNVINRQTLHDATTP